MFTLEMSPHPPEVAVSCPHVLALDRLILCLLLGVGAGQRHGSRGWVSVSRHNHAHSGVGGTELVRTSFD